MAAAALWFKTCLMVSLLLIMPFSYGSGMVEGFQLHGGMQQQREEAVYSLEQGGHGMIQMSSARKLLMMSEMLDYDDTSANQKHEHDPRKKPGKP